MRQWARLAMVSGCCLLLDWVLRTQPALTIWGGHADLLMCLTIHVGTVRGSASGMIIGCLCGLFQDAASGVYLGLHGMGKVLGGVLPDLSRFVIHPEHLWMRPALTVMAQALQSAVIYLILRSMRAGIPWSIFWHRTIGSLLATGLCALIVFPILDRVLRYDDDV